MNQNKHTQNSLQFTNQLQNIFLTCNKSLYENTNTLSQNQYNLNEEIQYQLKQVLKKLAFEKFSNKTINFEQNDKISIKMYEQNFHIQSINTIVKQVKFDLTKNQVFLVQNFEKDYYLSSDEKKQLYLPHSKLNLFSDEELSDEDESNYFKENIFIKIKVQLNYKIKSILKQNNQQQTIQKQQTQNIILISDQEGEITSNQSQTTTQKQELLKKIEDHQYGIGLKFLEKFGFELGSGLGIKKQGILEPVLVKEQNSFGHDVQNSILQQNFTENVLRKKRKIETIILSDNEEESQKIYQNIFDSKKQIISNDTKNQKKNMIQISTQL